jgi:glutamine synthetase
MTTSELKAYLHDNRIEKVKFAIVDIDGVLRGKVISTQKLQDVLNEGAGFCDVVFGWDSSDRLYGEAVEVTGWHTGFPDRLCHIDLSTFRTIPWQKNIPFFLADFSGSAGAAGVCPRTLLKKVTEEAASMGYTARFAQEFEWFNFLETPQSLHDKGYVNPQPITPGMFGYSLLRPALNSAYFDDLFTMLGQFGVPIEGLHTETGPGVYEAAIHHDATLAAADKAVLFKAGVKEIAHRHGIMASFMAKWNEALPGCSGHIHQSLWDADGEQSLFFDSDKPQYVSDLMRQYIAGQLYCLPYVLPLYAPTVNSYKRLVEGTWAPETITWAFENRTTALRVINTSPKAMRLETRVPGSDSNPYLAIAAALASGLYGIRHKLELTQPPSTGNAYLDKGYGTLPVNLYDATMAMRQSTVARELFGEAFVEHFAATRLWEWNLYEKQVSNWEIKRYFEII